MNSEENQKGIEEETENISGKNREIIEGEEQICIEDTRNGERENKINRTNNQMVFVNIAQVSSPETEEITQ
jgi:hypothetical protein